MTIHYQNKYSKGHEQQKRRPYFVIYESKDFFLAFPQTTKDKQDKEYPSHKNYTINDDEKIEIMIDQLQVIPKTQALKGNIMETSLSIALQKASISKLVSGHRNALINHFLEQVILQSQSYKKQQYKKSIVFGNVIKFNPHNKNPLLKPYNAFIALSCTQFHNSSIRLVAPYKNNSIIFELLH